jgi:glycosyltransferase involved in cell wall biosynthesis
MAHNYYQIPGGEEQVFQAEANLLEAKGHHVWRYTLDNKQLEGMSAIAQFGKTLWNSQVYQEMRSLIRQQQIQIVHFHNTFPLISPAAYYAAQAEGVPVIQTCHNYRLLCPNALFLRDGTVCEDCLGKSIPYPSVQHRCYRGSRGASAAVATMLTVHHLAKTWTNQVDRYIVLTEFARQKFIQGGIPSERIVVKPNFLDPDPGWGSGQGGYALFVGRLSVEKGVDVLLSAWKQLGDKLPLKIVGDGPLAPQVTEAVKQHANITWLGRKPSEEVYALMKDAMFLVFPSKWYEGLPRTMIESFAVGTPIVAASLGSMSSLVNLYQTGLHFQPGNAADLAAQVEWALAHPAELTRMRQGARTEFESRYTAARNYDQLMEIYA